MDHNLQLRKKYILYIRGILTFMILLLGIYSFRYISQSAQYIFFYLFVVFASNFVFISLPDRMYEGLKLHYIIFMLDIILIALGAYWLAGLTFEMLMVIFLTIFISAISQSVGLSLVIALVSILLYIFMKVNGVEGGLAGFFQEKEIMNLPFIFVVALHSSYLAEKAAEDVGEKKKLQNANTELSKKMKQSGDELENIISFTAKVYDAFREGIIITDNTGLIRAFNKSAELIFAARRTKVLNVNFRETSVLAQIAPALNAIMTGKQVSENAELTGETGGTLKRFIVNTSYIKDREDKILGVLCTVRMHIDRLGREI
jgi:PAS domain-containing protein